MTYRKLYPSTLSFDLKDTTLNVQLSGKTKYSPDLWSIKYLFDKGMGNALTKVLINGAISNTMALRMYYLKHLFPNVEFHDAKDDSYITDAKEIIQNVGTKYITYKSNNHSLENRGTKEKLESQIEDELAHNLSKHIPDFSIGSPVKRQFPSNVFENTISEENRRTDKLWIDIVSVNSSQELSPIELKVGGNIPLDLFAQGLDYGIYCYLFSQHIKKQWFPGYGGIKQDKVTIYYVGEEFHPALIGRGEEKGIDSLIKKNDLFNIVFVKISVDKKDRRITSSQVIFDTRDQ